MGRPVKLFPVTTIPAFAVILRAIHERGDTQREAIEELHRRRLWLSSDQIRQAELTDPDLIRKAGG